MELPKSSGTSLRHHITYKSLLGLPFQCIAVRQIREGRSGYKARDSLGLDSIWMETGYSGTVSCAELGDNSGMEDLGTGLDSPI